MFPPRTRVRSMPYSLNQVKTKGKRLFHEVGSARYSRQLELGISKWFYLHLQEQMKLIFKVLPLVKYCHRVFVPRLCCLRLRRYRSKCKIRLGLKSNDVDDGMRDKYLPRARVSCSASRIPRIGHLWKVKCAHIVVLAYIPTSIISISN